MQIRRVALTNWCQLNGEFEFGPGLNSIRGPNGAGKTNLVNSVVFALTGDISRLHGVKADNINFFAKGKKEKSSVVLEFVHKNTVGVIERILQPNPRQTLTLKTENFEKSFTRDAEIKSAMEKLLGINERMLLDYVFVQQWGIFKFIDQQPSVRAKALAELFGADRAEKIYKELGDVKIDIPAASVNADIVRGRIQTNQQQLQVAVKALHMYTKLPETADEATKAYRETLRKFDRAELLIDTIKNLKMSRTAETERVKALMFEIEPLNEQHEKLAAQLAAIPIDAVRQDAAQWKKLDDVARQRKDWHNAMMSAQHQVNELKATTPMPPADYLDGQAYNDALHRAMVLKSERSRVQAILLTFDEKGKVECPTCGTSVEHLQDKLAEYRKSVDAWKTELEQLSMQLLASNEHVNEKERLQKKIQPLEDTAKFYERKLNENDPASEERVPTDHSREQCVQLIAKRDKLVADIEYMEETLHIGNGKVKNMESDIRHIDQNLVKYETELQTCNVTEAEANEAEAGIKVVTSQLVERDKWRNRVNDIEKLITDDQEALARCNVEHQRAERLQQTVAHLDEVREVFHQLITVIPQQNMEELRAKINDNLDRFNTRFRVDAIDDLRFLLRYHSGRVQPAERLSGGERVMLALAFRIAVNSRYANELGLLCLDEPTAGLDEDNLGCLEVALARLRELSQALGLQVIMVTHDSGLDGLFDRVIQLKAAS